MQPPALLCCSLALWALLGQSLGTALTPKERRGWTLNSAGYLLGPYAPQALAEKGPAGKRDAGACPDPREPEPFGAGAPHADEAPLRELLDVVSYLRLQGERPWTPGSPGRRQPGHLGPLPATLLLPPAETEPPRHLRPEAPRS